MSGNTKPATSQGSTDAAGKGVSDEEFSREVSSETDPNLAAEDVFEREACGTDTDKPAEAANADDVQ
jgi:hypothetical protein